MVALPLKLTALARVTGPPLAKRVPPLSARVPVPSALSLPTPRVPALRVVVPPYVPADERTSRPLPALVKPQVPPVWPMPPDSVVVPVLLTVSVRLPVRVTAPLKVRSEVPPMVGLPPRVTALPNVRDVPLPAIVPERSVKVPLPRAPGSPTWSVPPLRVVPPP